VGATDGIRFRIVKTHSVDMVRQINPRWRHAETQHRIGRRECLVWQVFLAETDGHNAMPAGKDHAVAAGAKLLQHVRPNYRSVQALNAAQLSASTVLPFAAVTAFGAVHVRLRRREALPCITIVAFRVCQSNRLP